MYHTLSPSFSRRFAGHKLHVSGFVRKRSATGLTIPWQAKARLSLCSQGKCTGRAEHQVAVDRTYGSFSYDILFNEALVNYLGYNAVDLRLHVCTSSGGCVDYQYFMVDTVQVTIADPRPRTADLTLNAPEWAAPNTTFFVNGTAESLLGADMAGAHVIVTWNVHYAVDSHARDGYISQSAESIALAQAAADPSSGTGDAPCFESRRLLSF
jgi:hypothetical protein